MPVSTRPPAGKGSTVVSPQAHPVIRLALVDDQTMFREALRALIEQEPDLEVVAQVTSVQALRELDIEPQVVVTGLAFPDAASQVIVELRSRFRDAAILALTALDDRATVQQVLAAGADGYVLKSAATTDLFAGIRAVARGGLYLQPSIGIAFASRPSVQLACLAVARLMPEG